MKSSGAARLVVLSAFAVASVSVAASTFGPSSIPLYSFSLHDGARPVTALVQGRDGNFYGTTGVGGPRGLGTVFRVSPGGHLTTLYEFIDDISEGHGVIAALLEDADGNFYGTASEGGIYGASPYERHRGGTVFKITPGGRLTTLHYFSGVDGLSPSGGVVLGGDGNLYGTTAYGGPHGDGTWSKGHGTIFKITPGGQLTTLHNFNGQDGSYAYAGLVRADDGNFYGTTHGGAGAPGGTHGTVFKITPSGNFTTLHYFNWVNGAAPLAALVQGRDGNFYGTTYTGGANPVFGNFYGTVFKITPAGHFTTLHNFNYADGALPVGGLVQGRDGSFYGTTRQGGDLGSGTMYRITAAGSLTTLYSFGFGQTFSNSDGAYPYGGVVQASNGSFYGTTSEGGALDFGTVFRLSLDTTAATEEQCKNGGWARFSDPRAFKNQGDCIQFVNTGR